MSSIIVRPAFVALFVVSALLTIAQAQPLPSEINGRWTYQARLSNTFKLTEITVAPDKTFTAKLLWWTGNIACSAKGEPISGNLTDKGITWDFVTLSPCNDPYTIELNRKDQGWEGTATGKKSGIVAELVAK